MAVERIHQTAKDGTFCEELLSENNSEAVLVNFCCYDYGTNASEAVQKISTRTLDLYANSLKQLILYLQLFSSLLPLEIQARFLFFPDK